MLRFIFICLFIVNLLLFALWRGYVANPALDAYQDTRQPQRLQHQQNSDHLKLLSEQALAAAPVESLPETLLETHPDSKFPCLELGSFPVKNTKQFEAKLTALLLSQRWSRHKVQANVEDAASTMVFIPPSGSKQAADKKVLELKSLGVKDFFIIQEPANLRWGISLGVFKSEQAARQLLATLTNQGVRNAKIAARTVPATKFNYVFKEITSAEKSALDQLATEFPAQALHVCE